MSAAITELHPAMQNATATFAITLANRAGLTLEVDAGRKLLNTIEERGVTLPYGCRYGGCISCAAKLIEGRVDQSAGVALNARQLAAGYVLLCVARPESDCTLEIGVESHDLLYVNPFQGPSGQKSASKAWRQP